MPFLIGAVLAVAAAIVAVRVGLDRRTFYATVLIVVATYYILFAVMGGSSRAVLIESSIAAFFALLAAIGFRTRMWIVAAGLALHGAQDFVHGALVTNPGMPDWWPAFCGAYDIAAAMIVFVLLARDSRSPNAGIGSPPMAG